MRNLLHSGCCCRTARQVLAAAFAVVASAATSAADVSADEKKNAGNQELPRKVTGRVSDRVTGKPISGVVIEAQVQTGTPPDPKSSTQRKLKLRTNDKGEFTVELTPKEMRRPKFQLYFRASHSVYATKTKSYSKRGLQKTLQATQDRVLDDIKLLPGKEVTGVVETPDGKPLAKVKLTAFQRHPRYGYIGFEHGATDATGRFRLTAVTGGSGVFWLYPKGYAPQAHLIGDKRGDHGRFVVQKGFRIKGRVLSARGKPIPKTYVGARLRSGNSEVDAFLQANAVGNGIVRSTHTDKNGNFELDDLPAGEYSVNVETRRNEFREAAKHVFLSRRVKLAANENQPLILRAVPQVEIHARWVDSKGKPTVGPQFYVFGRLDGRFYNTRSPVPDPKTKDGKVTVRVPHGLQEARLMFITRSETAVRAQVKPGAPLTMGREVGLGTLNDDLPKVRLVKYAAPELTVKVVNAAGKTVSDIKLTSEYKRKPNAPGRKFRSRTGDVYFTKQRAGRWQSARMLPDLQLTVTVQKAGYTAKPQTVTLKEGKTHELVFVMSRQSKKKAVNKSLPRKATGRVSDRVTGKPVRGAVIAVQVQTGTSPNSGSIRRLTLRSNDDGKFTVEITPKELRNSGLSVHVQVSHAAYASTLMSFQPPGIRKALKSTQQFVFADIKLWPGKQVTGVVQTPDGKPLENVKLNVFHRHPRIGHINNGYAFTDKTGRFRFTAYSGGDGVFWLYPKGYAPQAHLIGDKRGDRGKFVVRKGIRLKGRVFSARGKPIPGVSIDARMQCGNSKIDAFLKEFAFGNHIKRSTRSDKEGNFEFDDLPVGAYAVRAQGWGNRARQKHVFLSRSLKLAANEHPPLTFRAIPQVAIQARFVDSKDKPIAAMQCSVIGRIDGRTYQAPFIVRDAKGGKIAFQVPHGLLEGALVFDPFGQTAFRVQVKPGTPLTIGNYVGLGNLEDDLPQVRIVKYAAPTLTVKAVDSTGKTVSGVTLMSDYKLGKDSLGRKFRSRTGDVDFAKLRDGRWRSSSMLPGLKLTVNVRKAGYTAKPQSVTLKEGAQKEIVFQLKRSP